MKKESEFYRRKLDNGLTVLFEKRKLPIMATCVAVKFGAQNESSDIKGISHFIEHLVFKGTKNRNVKEIPRQIESKGGILNAFTGEEITGFWNKLPHKYFNLGADIIRDLILNPLFEKTSLERERKVIFEEIKMYHDNPSSYTIEKIKEILYKPPFNMPIAGTMQTVSNLSRKKIINLFNSIYSANNLIFCAVGKSNFEEILKEAEKFPKFNKKINSIPIVLQNKELIEKRKGIDQTHIILGFHMPKLNDKNRYSAEIFDSILTNGMSSRLFQEVREKKGLCYSIRGCLEQSKDYSYEMIYAGTTKQKIKEIKGIILKEIKKLKNLNKSDFEENKEKLIGLRKLSNEKSESVMMGLLQEELAGNAKDYYKYEEKINAVKINDVRKLAKLKSYSFFGLVPDK